MLEQVELEYRIKNNGELMESLGYIEEKINDLIAAKVKLDASSLRLFLWMLKSLYLGALDGRTRPRKCGCNKAYPCARPSGNQFNRRRYALNIGTII